VDLRLPPSQSDFQSALRPLLKQLRMSPTFAMSLGSKELFHSNFLGYVFESREPGLCDLQSSLRDLFRIPRAADEESWCFAYRELSSLDLVLVPVKKVADKGGDSVADERNYEPSGAPAAVIEAKLKALPSAKQLQGYDQKLRKGVTVQWEDVDGVARKQSLGLSGKKEMLSVERWLLTLDGESPKSADPEYERWPGIAWSEVAERIATFASGTIREDLGQTMSVVFTDYAEGLQRLLAVVQRTRQLYLDSRSRCYADFFADITQFNELRAARLLDLVGKRAYSEWLTDVLDAVGTSTAACHEFGDPLGEAFLTRGTPGLTVEWNFPGPSESKSTLRIGVQIQGNSYRHFVAAKPKWAGLDEFVAASRLLKTWTAGTVTLASSGQVLMATRPNRKRPNPPAPVESKTRATNLRKFGEDAFLYSDVELFKSGATLADLQRAICQSMAHAASLVRGLRRQLPA
jgi:hypothetical protein